MGEIPVLQKLTHMCLCCSHLCGGQRPPLDAQRASKPPPEELEERVCIPLNPLAYTCSMEGFPTFHFQSLIGNFATKFPSSNHNRAYTVLSVCPFSSSSSCLNLFLGPDLIALLHDIQNFFLFWGGGTPTTTPTHPIPMYTTCLWWFVKYLTAGAAAIQTLQF